MILVMQAAAGRVPWEWPSSCITSRMMHKVCAVSVDPIIDPIRLWHKVAWFVFSDGLLGLCVRVWFKTKHSIASWDCRFFMRDGSQR